jgi:hypothetical protein
MGATYETAQERSAAVGWEVRQSCLLAGPAMSVELAFRTRPPTLTCNIIILFSPPEQPLPAAAPTARTPRALPHGAISAALGQRGSRASVLPSIEGDPEEQDRAQPQDVLSAISRGIVESTNALGALLVGLREPQQALLMHSEGVCVVWCGGKSMCGCERRSTDSLLLCSNVCLSVCFLSSYIVSIVLS